MQPMKATRRVVDKVSPTIVQSISSPVWEILRLGLIGSFKAILIVLLIILLACLLDQKIWCPLGCLYLTDNLCHQCPVKIALPPTHLVAEKSVLLAEQLSDVDLNTAAGMALARTTFVQIRSLIVHSHLEKPVQEELAGKLDDLKKLITEGAEKYTILTTSFRTTVNKMHNAIKHALHDLQESSHRHGDLITSNNTTEKESEKKSFFIHSLGSSVVKMKKSFEELMTSTVGQAKNLLLKAEDLHKILKLMEQKLETLDEVAAKGTTRNQNRLNRLQAKSLWSDLLEKENIEVDENKANLQLLDRLPPMIKNNLNKVGLLVIQLRVFKQEVTDLQEMASSREYSSSFFIEVQKHQLKQSLDSLAQFKQKLINKQKEPERSQFEKTWRRNKEISPGRDLSHPCHIHVPQVLT